MAPAARELIDQSGRRPPPPPKAGNKKPHAAQRAAVGQVSELWQRLRAARAFADLRQQDVAEALGKSRPSIALWESADAGNRTEPESDYIRRYAEVCKVPVTFLMDPTAHPDDVWRYKDSGATDPKVAANDAKARVDVNASRNALTGLDDTRSANFWGAVEFHMSEKSRDKQACFTRHTNPHQPDYLHDGNAVVFASDTAPAKSIMVGALAVLLHSEKLTGRTLQQYVMVHAGTGGAKIREADAAKLWGVTVVQVDTIKDAVKFLQSL